MTYIKISMNDKDTGLEKVENIRAEFSDDALEIAEELFPFCENFKVENGEREDHMRSFDSAMD